MNLEKWFVTPIWYDYTQFDYAAAANRCLELSKTYPNRVLSNAGGWQSSSIDLREYSEFHIIHNTICYKINEIAKQINQEGKLQLDNVWINLNYPGSSNLRHVHPVTAFSGTIYISVNERSGRIVFFGDSPIIHYTFKNKGCELFYDEVYYTPKNGMIVMFPAWVPHAVERNESDDTRISISFNVSQIQDAGVAQR